MRVEPRPPSMGRGRLWSADGVPHSGRPSWTAAAQALGPPTDVLVTCPAPGLVTRRLTPPRLSG